MVIFELPVSSLMGINFFFPQGAVILETYSLTIGQMKKLRIQVKVPWCW